MWWLILAILAAVLGSIGLSFAAGAVMHRGFNPRIRRLDAWLGLVTVLAWWPVFVIAIMQL